MTRVELVCFHHAGGSASFLPLRRALAALGARILEDVTLERI